MLDKMWSVFGSTSRYGGTERKLYVRDNETEQPTMLNLALDLEHYLDDIGDSDMEEKYMRKLFIYNDNCDLLAIVIPSVSERDYAPPAKAVMWDALGGKKIFGQKEIFNDENPKPMSEDEWRDACDYAESGLWKYSLVHATRKIRKK